MSELDLQEVRRIARLARLTLSAEEAEALAGEMGEVLGHFGEIREREERSPGRGELETGREPAGELRPDRPNPDALHRSPEEMAPEWREGLFVVPRLEALGTRAEDADLGAASGGPGGEEG